LPTICRAAAPNPENAADLTRRGVWFGAAPQPIVGKPTPTPFGQKQNSGAFYINDTFIL
jgi:hypothetical protein